MTDTYVHSMTDHIPLLVLSSVPLPHPQSLNQLSQPGLEMSHRFINGHSLITAYLFVHPHAVIHTHDSLSTLVVVSSDHLSVL